MRINKLLNLIFALIFTFVSVFAAFPGVTASASTIELADGDYENALNVLKSICPDFPLSNGEKTTRAEFVAAVTMALNMPKGTTATSKFIDVASDDKYASNIAYAADMGIVSNVALFYPDSNVTYAQAIKIVMSAAGYDKKAEYNGGFPTGYMLAANAAGVGKGINLDNEMSISHEVATKLIFEACCIDMMEATSFGSAFNYTVTEGKNIFSTYHNIFMVEGVVEANENTGLQTMKTSLANDYITVDGIDYKAPGCQNLIGKRVRLLYKNDNHKSVIYAYEKDNTETIYTGEDGLSISGTSLTAYSEKAGKQITHTLEADYAVIYNGKCLISANYNPFLAPNSGVITLVDNDDNRAIDVIIIKSMEYGYIGSINPLAEKIYDKYKKNGIIDLSNSGVKYSVKDADGTVLKLEDLEQGDAIGYAVSNDKKVYEIIRCSNKIGGTYEALTSDGKIMVKNNEYKLSNYYTSNVKSLSSVKLGEEVIIYLSSDNQVIYIQEYSTSLQYGFLLATAQGSGLDSRVKVKIYTEKAEMLEADIAEKINLDGSPKTSQSEIKNYLDTTIAKQYAYRVVKFSQNAEGKVNKIFTAIDNTNGTNVFFTQPIGESRPVIYHDTTAVSGSIPETGDVPYTLENAARPFYSRGAFTPYFHAGSATKIMQVPVRPSQFEDEDNFRVYTSLTDAYYRAVAYDVSYGGIASFVVISADASAGSIGKYDGSAIIESITQGMNEDGQVVTILNLFYAGAWAKYYFDPEKTKISAEKSGGDGTEPQSTLTIADFGPGDIIRISADNKNVIGEMTMNFDCSAKAVASGLEQKPDGNGGRYVEYMNGYALSYADNRVVLATGGLTIDQIHAAGGAVDISNTYSGSLIRGTTVFVKIHRDRSTGAVKNAEVYKEADLNSVETYFNSGKEADYVVLRQYFRDITLNVFYVNIDG